MASDIADRSRDGHGSGLLGSCGPDHGQQGLSPPCPCGSRNVASFCGHDLAAIAALAGRLILGALAMALVFASSARASRTIADPSSLCEEAIRFASDREQVPLSVLSAIALNESGRKGTGGFRAWPWTVNMEGKGVWFDGPDEALAYARREFDRGARSFDVGCLQINYRWHGQNFASIEQMFDPTSNAIYAARFLRALYAERGSWEAAAGAYHSLNPVFATPYAARFLRLRADFLNRNGGEVPVVPELALASYGGSPDGMSDGMSVAGDWGAPAVPPPNRFPLLMAGGGAGIGSVVPLDNNEVAALFEPARAAGAFLSDQPQTAGPDAANPGPAALPSAPDAPAPAPAAAAPDALSALFPGGTSLGAFLGAPSPAGAPSPLPDLPSP